MNVEQQLELQAWVDGELPERDARRIAQLASTDPEAKALAAELRMVKAIVHGNEPVVAFPENPDFYWSKIQRQIESADNAQPARVSWLFAWRRLLAPISAVALIASVSVVSLNLFNRGEVDDPHKYLVEVENLSDEVSSISYKSQSENMFVVYLYAKEQQPAEVDLELEPMDETVIQ
jgi:anti-sigma factor RsiW